jgi:hypothetical protein
VRMDNRIAWKALTSGSATLRLINMNRNKLRKHIVRMMIIGFLLLLLPMTGIAAEQSKPPGWILDTIILPMPLNSDISVGLFLFKDKKGEIIIYYYNPLSSSEKLIDLTTHQEIDRRKLALFPNKTNSLSKTVDSLEMIKSYLDFVLPNNIYKIWGGGSFVGGGGRCGSPLDGYLTFYTVELGREVREVDKHLFLLSSTSNKFKFQTNGFCFGMNGKERIEVHNEGVIPRFWMIENNRIVLGEEGKAFLIVIDAKKIDLALSETKAMIFDHAGFKLYWIKKSLIDEWIKKAIEELRGKGYDIYSKKPLKGNTSVNEYIDQAITDELNKSN